MLTSDMEKYIAGHREEAVELLLRLARIPAPSRQEHRRAEFISEWLRKRGAREIHVDEALNVVLPLGCTDSRPLNVLMAHTDTVFGDLQEIPLVAEEGRIKAPGVADNTAHVVLLMMAAGYLLERRLVPRERGLLLVANSCEEGLGNLDGCRKIMEVYADRVREFIALDGTLGSLVKRSTGSRRYRVRVTTEGGHSYEAFGNRNAIVYLASMIGTLYDMKVPNIGKTTYNVGTIRGGTSVNTIAAQAEMLYEFRSDERQALDVMERHFTAVADSYRTKGIGVEIEPVGERPCMGGVDPDRHRELADRVSLAVRRHAGVDITCKSGSTDCNIPLALGIPAVCVGCVAGGGAHTLEEWMELSSMEPGMRIVFDLIAGYL